MRALLFGAGGMLSDAARYIAARASHTVLISRNPGPLAAETGAEALSFDWKSGPALPPLTKRFDLLLSWAHDEALSLIAPLEAALRPGGRSVRIHGASSADPVVKARRNPGPRDDISRQTVILGWSGARGGAWRWLTHAEISAAAIAAFEAPARETVIAGGFDE